MTKLTDKQKKKIIADYVDNGNYSLTARMNNISETTCRRILKEEKNKEVVEKVELKKEENTLDILEYMDSIADKQKKIIDLSLEAIEEKLAKPDMFTNVKDIVTVYGVIFDKALKYKELKSRQTNPNAEQLSKVEELLSKIKEEANDNNG